MTPEHSNPIFQAPAPGAQAPDLMLSSVLHLMSHYTASAADDGACVKLAAVIERHLHALSNLPGLAPVLSATCQQLAEQWATVVDRKLERNGEATLLGRLLGRPRGAGR